MTSFFKKKKLWLLLGLTTYFVTALALMRYFEIGCVFLYFTGISCPGCGMTRALFALLRLDFWGAVKHNVLIFFMPYVCVYILFNLKHKVHKRLIAMVGVVAIINWIIKIFI